MLGVCFIPLPPPPAPRLYEEVEPARVLDERRAASGSGKEYLVQYAVSDGQQLQRFVLCMCVGL